MLNKFSVTLIISVLCYSFSITGFAQIPSLSVDVNGRVGVGTDTPETIFEINESNLDTAVRMRLTNSANDTSWEYVHRAHVDDAFAINTPTYPGAEMILYTNGDLRIMGDFITLSGGKLDVPDYVFKPNYNLMPIEDFRKFIKEESHLPNVPSAADIGENGINISTFQLTLLEKIEELSLYTLQQHDQIKTLETRLVELERQLDQ